MKIQHLLLLSLLIASCSSNVSETVTVKAYTNTDYLISNQDYQSYFSVVEISYEEDEKFLEEKIIYKLHTNDGFPYDTKKSFIKYKRTKQEDGSYLLEIIDGSATLSQGNISFKWSFGSENHIYLYLPKEYSFEAIE